MFSVGTKNKFLYQLKYSHNLAEYVTKVAWSSDGLLAASSAAGEVVLWQDGNLINLLAAGLTSIDSLAFSDDGKFLAAGGQDGTVRIWLISPASQEKTVKLIANLENGSQWIDKLSWSPNTRQLAFSLGRYVQIWDVETQTVVTTLPFSDSSVLDLAWQPNGEHIAIAGYGGMKIWDANNWDDDPYLVDMSSASIVIAWSNNSKYIASGNLDNTIMVLEYSNPHPWIMQGFPGKISNLTWSQSLLNSEPLLAASSMEGIAIWKKTSDEEEGWNADVLTVHKSKIQALEFHPHRLLLASAADEGWLCLWSKAQKIRQILEGARNGFSCLAWSRDGQKLAAGGQHGELLIWSESKRAKGFG